MSPHVHAVERVAYSASIRVDDAETVARNRAYGEKTPRLRYFLLYIPSGLIINILH